MQLTIQMTPALSEWLVLRSLAGPLRLARQGPSSFPQSIVFESLAMRDVQNNSIPGSREPSGIQIVGLSPLQEAFRFQLQDR